MVSAVSARWCRLGEVGAEAGPASASPVLWTDAVHLRGFSATFPRSSADGPSWTRPWPGYSTYSAYSAYTNADPVRLWGRKPDKRGTDIGQIGSGSTGQMDRKTLSCSTERFCYFDCCCNLTSTHGCFLVYAVQIRSCFLENCLDRNKHE